MQALDEPDLPERIDASGLSMIIPFSSIHLNTIFFSSVWKR